MASRLLRRRPRFAPADLPTARPARPDLTVAVVLDPFSELAFRYEWNQVTFGPDDWRAVLGRTRPDLLFVESAWQGNAVAGRRGRTEGRWRLHMTRDDRPSPELAALVAWCRAEGIPTVFWNKEDPPNYDRFLETARLFDQVFTVDAERIPDYQRDLGHDRIDLLPFAAQPRIHNPVRRAPKTRDIAFAGTWFAEKHPERREQMAYVLGPARERGLHIWSRMQRGDRRYRFPRSYRRHVVGSLPYERMLAAYTSYKVFLNVNSVTRSKTMCSRRLFELSAAQTAVVSAPAASIEPFFGPTIEVVENAEETGRALDVLLGNAEYRDRLALQAHRRVFDEHLYAHRVDTVLRSVGLPASGSTTPLVSVVVPTKRPEQLDHVLATIARQSHRAIELVLVTHGFTVETPALDGVDVVVVPADADLTLGACMNLGVEAATGDLVAKVDDDNVYGAHYLTDLVRALDYSGADVVGKWAHLVHLESSGATLLRFEKAEHRFVEQVQGGTLLMRRSVAERIRFEDLPRRVDTTFLAKVRAAGLTVYAADRFNFVSVRRADTGSHTWPISDKELMARSSRLLFYGDPTSHAEA
jgi:spore maturation protein CgeB